MHLLVGIGKVDAVPRKQEIDLVVGGDSEVEGIAQLVSGHQGVRDVDLDNLLHRIVDFETGKTGNHIHLRLPLRMGSSPQFRNGSR